VKVMKSLFADYKTPTMAECEMLGREIGLPKRVVQVWFQNARAKEKKSKLALQKAYGQEPEPQKLPEECKLCAFKYSHKYSVQDHIFTRKHIDNVKSHIESGKLELSERFPAPPTPVSTPGPGSGSNNGGGGGQSAEIHDSALPSSTAAAAAAAAAAIFNAGNSSGLNGQQQQQQQAALFQQLQLLQLAAATGASGSANNLQQEDVNSASELTASALKNLSSGDELNLIQLYGLGSGSGGSGTGSLNATASGGVSSSLNPLMHPLMSASSGCLKKRTVYEELDTPLCSTDTKKV